MEYYDATQAAALRTAVEKKVFQWTGVEVRSMFGCPAYVVDGRLFAFLVSDGIVMTQLRKAEKEALAKHFETEVFQVGEREMPAWLKVTVSELSRLPRALHYLKKSYETAAAL